MLLLGATEADGCLFLTVLLNTDYCSLIALMITVVIPAHNSERTIKEALDSVVAQTVFRKAEGGNLRPEGGENRGWDVEIIIVDDASTDRTGEIVKSYQLSVNGEKSNSHTPLPCHFCTPILISLPRNAGPATARNRGIAAAKGEWIAFLDADDAWLPEKLAVQMEYVKKNPDVAMWCGGVKEYGCVGVWAYGSK